MKSPCLGPGSSRGAQIRRFEPFLRKPLLMLQPVRGPSMASGGADHVSPKRELVRPVRM